jgi:hypothetical protein
VSSWPRPVGFKGPHLKIKIPVSRNLGCILCKCLQLNLLSGSYLRSQNAESGLPGTAQKRECDARCGTEMRQSEAVKWGIILKSTLRYRNRLGSNSALSTRF